nr:hypothetical protein [bacterium]
MSDSDRILYDQGHYRIVQHGPLDHAVTIVGFQNLRPEPPVLEREFPKPFLTPTLRSSGAPVNYVSFLVSRNTWYCDAAAEVAAQALRAQIAGTRVVTYGSSMGGFGAINMSGVLDAELFIAFAPQATTARPFIKAIRDGQFGTYLDPYVQHDEHMMAGELMDREGVIFVDPSHTADAAHASLAASMTRARIVNVPHVGHGVVRSLTRILPMREVFQDIADRTFDVVRLRRTILERRTRIPEYLAARPEHFAAFLDICRKDAADLSPKPFLNAALTLGLYRHRLELGGLTWREAADFLIRVIDDRGTSWNEAEVIMKDKARAQLADLRDQRPA